MKWFLYFCVIQYFFSGSPAVFGKELFKEDFEKYANGTAGYWWFNSWSAKNPKSGGTTTTIGAAGEKSLEVLPVGKGYAGWCSPGISIIPEKEDTVLKIRFKLKISADYQGNNPGVFIGWFNNKKFISPKWLDLSAAMLLKAKGHWQEFSFKLSDVPAESNRMAIHFVSKAPAAGCDSPTGKLYFDDVIVSREPYIDKMTRKPANTRIFKLENMEVGVGMHPELTVVKTEKGHGQVTISVTDSRGTQLWSGSHNLRAPKVVISWKPTLPGIYIIAAKGNGTDEEFALWVKSDLANPGYDFNDDFSGYRPYADGRSRWDWRYVFGHIVNNGLEFNSLLYPSHESEGQPQNAVAMANMVVSGVIDVSPGKIKLENPWKPIKTRYVGIGALLRGIDNNIMKRNDGFRLLLDEDVNTGKRSFDLTWQSSGTAGDLITSYSRESWSPGRSFRLFLEVSGSVVAGTVCDVSGRVIWRKLLRNPKPGEYYPAIVGKGLDCRFTGFSVKGNTDSAPRLDLKLPIKWVVFPGIDPKKVQISKLTGIPKSLPGKNGMVKGISALMRNNTIDIGKLTGHILAKEPALLLAELHSPRKGYVQTGTAADWWMDWSVNGKSVFNTIKHGNVKTDFSPGAFVFKLPVKEGNNLLAVKVLSGIDGWKFVCGKPPAYSLYSFEQKKSLWEIDSLLYDLSNLKRRGITLPAGAEQQLNKLKAELETRSFSDIEKAALTRIYREVYLGYQCSQLHSMIKKVSAVAEFKRLPAPGLADMEQKYKEACEAVAAGDFTKVQTIMTQTSDIVTAAWNKLDRNGMVRSRADGAGRFGWITGAESGWDIGDGLLANLVTATGLTREFVFATDNAKKLWKISYSFSGKPSSALRKEFARPSLTPKIREDVMIGNDPYKVYAGGTPEDVNVLDINWVYKKFSYANRYLVSMSLVSPVLLLESPYSQFVLNDGKASGYDHCTIPLEQRTVNRKFASEGVIYDSARDGRLQENWILLWSERDGLRDFADHTGSLPVQVIFQHHPLRITRAGNSIRIDFAGAASALWLNTPFGARIQTCSQWRGTAPEAALTQCRFWAQAALAYPVGCQEFYQYADNGEIKVTNVFQYREFPNDWNIKPVKVATIPPLLAFAVTALKYASKVDGELIDLHYPTLCGPLMGLRSGRVSYTLQVPETQRMGLPRNLAAHQENVKLLNLMVRLFIHDQRLFIGSKSFHLIMGRNPNCQSESLVDYVPQTQAWPYLPENMRKYFMDIAPGEMLHSLDRGDWVWRETIEPYTGRKSFYSHSIRRKHKDEIGVMGDRNFGIGTYLLALDDMAAYSGSWDIIRRYWKDPSPLAPDEAISDGKMIKINNMLTYFNNFHDWAWMDTAANDTGGNGPVVDCAQATHGGYAALRRMAGVVGSDEDRLKYSYLLAKSTISLVSRLPFGKYALANGIMGKDDYIAGFRESSKSSGRDHFANSLICSAKEDCYYSTYLTSLFYAYNDYWDLFFPDFRYILPELQHYEKMMTERNQKTHYAEGMRYLQLLLTGTSGAAIIERIKKDRMVTKIMSNSPPAWCFPLKLKQWIFSLVPAISAGCPLTIGRWEPMLFPDSTFDAAKKTVTIAIRNAPENYRLDCLSTFKPKSVKVNGQKSAAWSYDAENNNLTIKLPKGDSKLEVLYEKILFDRFEPIPIYRNGKKVPVTTGQ